MPDDNQPQRTSATGIMAPMTTPGRKSSTFRPRRKAAVGSDRPIPPPCDERSNVGDRVGCSVQLSRITSPGLIKSRGARPAVEGDLQRNYAEGWTLSFKQDAATRGSSEDESATFKRPTHCRGDPLLRSGAISVRGAEHRESGSKRACRALSSARSRRAVLRQCRAAGRYSTTSNRTPGAMESGYSPPGLVTYCRSNCSTTKSVT